MTRATLVQAASSAAFEIARQGRFADGQQLRRGRRIGGKFGRVLGQQFRQYLLLIGRRRPGQRAAIGPGDTLRRRGAAFAHDAGGQGPRRLDVGRVVQQHQRLQRRVRARPLDRALLAAGRVEGQQAGVQERAAPVGVQAAAIQALAVVVLVLAHREIQVRPVAAAADTA